MVRAVEAWLRIGAAAGLCLALAACGRETPAPKPGPDYLSLAPTHFDAIPGWVADDVGAAIPALKRSCAALMKQPDNRPVGPDALAGTVADWRGTCSDAAAIADTDSIAARAFFETRFRPFQASARDSETGLFTGYYEAELRGARTPQPGITTPLYRRPGDLVTVDLGEFRADWKGQRIAGRVVEGRLKPYATRADIAAGALANRKLELVWVDDRIDAFFLEIQGSGRVILPDGSVMRIGYDSANGHPYVPIGRELVARGALTKDTVSMQTIRAWLAANPAEAPAVMALNPSVVFFRENKGDGPLGAQGVALTPGRSLAVDPAFLALGLPVFVDITGGVLPETPIRRLVVAQDTGGAIKGPVRGDLFWGYGHEAGEKAGIMKGRGTYYLLLPFAVAERRLKTS